MSTNTPEGPAPIDRVGTVYIVASRYNPRFTDAMVSASSDRLTALGPNLNIEVVRVPGAFEIPIVVSRLAASKLEPLAIIALGVIIRGSTAHADLIADAITRSLLNISTDYQIPVIHEVLLLETEQQAEERTLGDRLNRGRESAEAAIAMILTMDELNEGFEDD